MPYKIHKECYMAERSYIRAESVKQVVGLVGNTPRALKIQVVCPIKSLLTLLF